MKLGARLTTLVVLVTLTLLKTTHAQGDLVPAFQGRGSNAGDRFEPSTYNPLSTLAEGPYPRAFAAELSLPPIMAGPEGAGVLQKRQCSCPSGWGCCDVGASAGKCCKIGQLCSPAGGCCAGDMPYTCNGRYCCPYPRCAAEGCGCPGTEYRCGNRCCYYGCTSGGDCACPSTHPVDCNDGKTCCPSGSVCTSDGKCRSSVVVPPPPPPPRPDPPASSYSPPTQRPFPTMPPTPSRAPGSGGNGDTPDIPDLDVPDLGGIGGANEATAMAFGWTHAVGVMSLLALVLAVL